jgi:hypothetical protein
VQHFGWPATAKRMAEILEELMSDPLRLSNRKVPASAGGK